MRITGLGRVLFALSIALLGAFTLFFPGFALSWPMVPKWIAWHDTLATISAAILLAGGILLLVPRTARMSALVLAAFLLLRLLLLAIPPVVAHPLVEVTWESLSESIIAVAGAWTIFSLLPREGGMRANSGNVRAGQILFALALPAIGLSHMVYLNQTAPLIPSWLPFHVLLAYFTGAAYIAAGVGILFGVLPRLAATLTAIMVSLFTLLVWVPMVIAAPTSRGDWSEFCVSTAITGAAWAVAESFRGKWLSARR
jgi:uncharacterized membrane protein